MKAFGKHLLISYQVPGFGVGWNRVKFNLVFAFQNFAVGFLPPFNLWLLKVTLALSNLGCTWALCVCVAGGLGP